jgi:hypothetical protein
METLFVVNCTKSQDKEMLLNTKKNIFIVMSNEYRKIEKILILFLFVHT